MAALDDILGGSGYSGVRKPMQVSPPPIDPSLQGAPNSVGSKPVSQPTQKPSTTSQPQAPGTDATKVVGNPGEAPQPTGQPQMSYVEMFKMLNPERPETAEEKAKREKREKGEAILSAVGDGISALSNLWFTSQYAPNAYDPSKGMSAATKERWDRLRQEREANRRAYSDGYMRAMAMDETKDREDRNWRHTIEREKIADERYEVKEAREKALADLNEQLKRHQITAAEYKAEQERIAALFAEGTEQLKQENLRAGVQQKRAAAGASNASASASYARADHYRNGGGGGHKTGPTLQLEDDEPMRFGDDKDYDRTVMRLAPDYGVPTTTVEVTEKDRHGKPKKQRTVKRDVKDIAADIEREAAKRRKEKSSNNTMPGVGGNGGSANTMPGVK
ncbi:hypothetical protein [uncultured Duncaniella sp.]|uniref:hypothetical protein n=1 Tax=uncultured Duncaniella sp. TaxID=2768039 RepID=UPI0026F38246|nr:hypothetical protein [uncultured Duncaniella sp.]